MKRELHRLHPKSVLTVTDNGNYHDGGGLSLVIRPDRKAWSFRYTWKGKEEYLGFGSAKSVSLAEAREKAAVVRKLLADKINPKSNEQKLVVAIPTFGEIADEYIREMRPSWRNEKHIAQWVMTLSVHAKLIRHMPVDQITTDDVLTVLKPIWNSKNETASRLRGRIEKILAAATVKGFRQGINPAQWKNHLDLLLPTRSIIERGHHGALPYADIPWFVSKLQENGSISALAFEFLILTATRTSETLEADWSEIDLETRVWTIPSNRMKNGKEYRIPLTERPIMILQHMAQIKTEGFIFPGRKAGRPLSNMAMEVILRRMGMKEKNVTVHGMRSSFRDWTGEETDYSRELAELSLSHTIGDAVERAYRRGDAVERRRPLMEAWAEFASSLIIGNDLR